MAFDTYMKISTPDVAGEAQADGYTGWMEIYSFSWGASNPVTVGSGSTGLAGGKVSLSGFSVMKKSETASAGLFNSCCTGQHYGKIEVDMRKATGNDGGQKKFLTYEFGDCMVESIQWSGSTGGDDSPTESLSFAFSRAKVTYYAQDAKGALKSSGEASWDQTKVKK